jgi:hypothetical protein
MEFRLDMIKVLNDSKSYRKVVILLNRNRGLKLIVSLILIMSLCVLASCNPFKDRRPYPDPLPESLLHFTELGDKERWLSLKKLDELTFAPFGTLSNEGMKRLLGEPIGIVDTEGYEEIILFSVNGYSEKEWLIEVLNVFMSGGYGLLKEDGVTQIPDELKEFEEYDWQIPDDEDGVTQIPDELKEFEEQYDWQIPDDPVGF